MSISYALKKIKTYDAIPRRNFFFFFKFVCSVICVQYYKLIRISVIFKNITK